MIHYELNSHVSPDTGELPDLPGGIDLLNSFALSGGKKFRPHLVLTLAQCLGVNAEQAEPYAVAAERIHNATLLHDDVIDESTTRRGKATLNASGENHRAVLGGDLLLAQTLRDFGATEDLSALRELFAVLVELAEGEWLQLEARYRAPIEVRHLYEVAQKKTGSLIGWCCWAPAHLAATPHALAFRRMGVQLGIAFQIIDDCVDFDVTSGKPFANDLREGQINFVTQDFLVHHPDKISDIFSPEALALIRGSDLSLLTPSLGRTLNKAQIEIETARNLLRQTKLPLSITHTIEGKIIEPFLAQLKMIRARLERTL